MRSLTRTPKYLLNAAAGLNAINPPLHREPMQRRETCDGNASHVLRFHDIGGVSTSRVTGAHSRSESDRGGPLLTARRFDLELDAAIRCELC